MTKSSAAGKIPANKSGFFLSRSWLSIKQTGVLATVLSGASAELYGSLQSSYGTGYDNGAAAKYCSDFNVGYHREI